MACPALRVSLMHSQLATTCHRQGAYRARRLWSLRPLATLLAVTLDPNKDWPILLTCRHRLCSKTDMAFLRVFFSRCATGMGAGTSCYVADYGADILLLQMSLHVHRSHKAYYGRGAQDGHLDFHTAPELFNFYIFIYIYISKKFSLPFQCWFTSTETTRLITNGEHRTTTSTFTRLLNCANLHAGRSVQLLLAARGWRRLQASTYYIIPPNTATTGYATGPTAFRWCSNGSMLVYNRRVSLIPAHNVYTSTNKTEIAGTEREQSISLGAEAADVYMRASTLCSFHRLITQTFLKFCGRR